MAGDGDGTLSASHFPMQNRSLLEDRLAAATTGYLLKCVHRLLHVGDVVLARPIERRLQCVADGLRASLEQTCVAEVGDEHLLSERLHRTQRTRNRHLQLVDSRPVYDRDADDHRPTVSSSQRRRIPGGMQIDLADDDDPRTGEAWAENQCLIRLSGCEPSTTTSIRSATDAASWARAILALNDFAGGTSPAVSTSVIARPPISQRSVKGLASCRRPR